MSDFLNSLPQTTYSTLFEYIKILVPAFITYLATRYTLTKPRKYEIKEKQFNLVYLPLYLLTLQYISGSKKDISNNLPTYLKKVDKLFYKNYPLIYPKTLRLFDELKIESTKQKMNFYFISNFEHQVIADYNILKKELGYPSDSISNSIKQLNELDKIFLFSDLFFGILFLIFAIKSFLSLLNLQISQLFSSLLISITCAFALFLFHYMKKH